VPIKQNKRCCFILDKGQIAERAIGWSLSLTAEAFQLNLSQQPTVKDFMKTRSSPVYLTVTIAALSLLPLPAGLAAEAASSIGEPASPAAGVSATVEATTPAVTTSVTADSSAQAPRLPYGVEDVVKLSRAQVNEDVIVSYVQTSGTIYSLAPKDLVYLKEVGVSDRVVNTMLDQRKRAAEVAAQTAPQQPIYQDNTPTATSPTYADSTAVDAAPAEAQPAPSTLYVIPYTPSSYSYYGYPGYYSRPYYVYGGYYGGYSRYCGPSVVARIGHASHGHSYGHARVGHH
jgi:hypothetical protein